MPPLHISFWKDIRPNPELIRLKVIILKNFQTLAKCSLPEPLTPSNCLDGRGSEGPYLEGVAEGTVFGGGKPGEYLGKRRN